MTLVGYNPEFCRKLIAVTYAYDIGTGPLSQYAYGNHSFGLSFHLSGRLRWNQRLEDIRKPFFAR